MGAQSEWFTGLGLCPRAAIAIGPWMWSLPCSPNSRLSQVCLSLLLVRTLRERQHEGQSQSWGLDHSSPEGTGTSLENSPYFWAMEGLGYP